MVSMVVLPSDGGKLVMKCTEICDHGQLGMGNGRRRPAGAQ